MIYETYICWKVKGATEYGYCFKLAKDDDCLPFDLVLGELPGEVPQAEREEKIAKAWADYEWAAKAIAEAGKARQVPAVAKE